MADVRSLLRNERVSRRINHPNATYTESGKLVCTACNIQIKTESLWENHIATPQHVTRAQQLRTRPPPPPPTQSKKRKAGGDEDEGRKRVKAVPGGFVPEGFFDATNDGPEEEEEEQEVAPVASENAIPQEEQQQQPSQAAAVAPVPDVNEDEWAAFEREIAVADQPATTTTNPGSGAVISAAPLTAEELAAQAREEQSAQRGAREAEIEADTEDAARALEQEFDEMEDLDERVRRLREKREALRISKLPPDILPDAPAAPLQNDDLEPDDDDEDEDDDDDEFDDWTFGAR